MSGHEFPREVRGHAPRKLNVMITISFEGKLRFFFFWGGGGGGRSFYPSNTLDRTLISMGSSPNHGIYSVNVA